MELTNRAVSFDFPDYADEELIVMGLITNVMRSSKLNAIEKSRVADWVLSKYGGNNAFSRQD